MRRTGSRFSNLCVCAVSSSFVELYISVQKVSLQLFINIQEWTIFDKIIAMLLTLPLFIKFLGHH